MPLPALPGPGPTAKVFAKNVGQGAVSSDGDTLRFLSNHVWPLSNFLSAQVSWEMLGIHLTTYWHTFSNHIYIHLNTMLTLDRSVRGDNQQERIVRMTKIMKSNWSPNLSTHPANASISCDAERRRQQWRWWWLAYWTLVLSPASVLADHL